MNCGAAICNSCMKMSQDRMQCNYCKKEHVKRNFYPNNAVNSLLQIYKQLMDNKCSTDENNSEADKNCIIIREAQKKIESEYALASETVKSSVNKLIGEIISLKNQLLNEIALSKNEYLKNLDMTFYQNIEMKQIE